MKKMFVLTTPAVAAMLLSNSAVALNADGTVDDSSMSLESPVLQQVETVSPVDCSVDTGEIVALDTYNGATTADHTKLVSDLEAAGFTVGTINTSVDGIPACVAKLIITTQAFNRCLITPSYPPALVDLILARVDAGLGLYLNNEWGPSCGPGTAPIANALDATWNGNIQNVTFVAGVNYTVGTPPILFDGVDSWNWFAGSNYTAAIGVVATNEGIPAMIAKEYGSGCVVITGDSNYIADRWIDINDNRTLASNAIAYLNDCIIQEVKIDLKPGSNPNCVNPNSRGGVAVAVFGTADFDVAEIDQSTLEFGGALVERCSFEDALMEGPTGVFTTDGITDLVCHFATADVDWPDRGTNCGTIELTGELLNGKKIEGSDIACIPGEATCEAGIPLPIE